MSNNNWNRKRRNPYTFAYDNTGAIIYAIMGDQIPSWWPQSYNFITLDDDSEVPGHKFFNNQRGTPFANANAPTLTPYFNVVAQGTSNANQYTVTATLMDPSLSPPTTCTFNVNGTNYSGISVTNNVATYTLTVAAPTQQTNITVTATGVSAGYATIMPIAQNNFSGAVNTVLLNTTEVNVTQVVAPSTPTLSLGSGGIGAYLSPSTTYTYGFTAVDAQGNETNLGSTNSISEGTTAVPINISATAVSNAQSYWLYRNGVRLIQLSSPAYTDTGSVAPSSTNAPTTNKTGAIVAGSTVTAPTLVATSTTAPLQLPNLSAVPGTVGPSGTICVVNGLWYLSNGSAWNAMSSVLSPATSTTLGGVKVGSGLSVLGDGTLSTNASSVGAVSKTGDTMTGTLTITSVSALANNPASGNAGIEHGSTSVSSTPFIDFHSSGNNIDYDSRIIANGGSATVGSGTMQFVANNVTTSNKFTPTRLVLPVGTNLYAT